MPRQNRVTPFGDLIADPARGLLMGNRGCLHDAAGRIGAARFRTRRWIACKLAFKRRHRQLLQPGRYTELFFLDEATTLAAGHRPCFECRRAEARHFQDLWRSAVDADARADAIDHHLHTARLEPGGHNRRTFAADPATLPAGTLVVRPDPSGSDVPAAALVGPSALQLWSPAGYGPPLPKPTGLVEVLTPAPLVRVLRAGYQPILHPSVNADR